MKRPAIRDDGIYSLLRYIERHPHRRRHIIKVCRGNQRQREKVIREAKRNGYYQHWHKGLASIDDHPVVRARNEYRVVAEYGHWLDAQPVQEELFG